MQSTFSGLNTMVNGIYTNRLALNTVGHNISNSNTEGYSRQTANAAATLSSTVYTLAGSSQVGNGSTVTSVVRARDIYADRQFWKENSSNGYYTAKASNYAKIESIFNDSDDSGIQQAMEAFYQAWEDASTNASSDTSRQNVINAGQNFAERLDIAATQVQKQIESLYDDITLSVDDINTMLGQIVELNKNITGIEASGAHANDLRDQRDLIVDQLSNLTDITVYEDSQGMYTLVSNGNTLVNGINKVDLEISAPINNKEYGISDYQIIIKQTGTVYTAGNGELKAQFEGIEEDKEYIDQIANMAAFMLTTMNDQHKAGYGIDGNKDTPIGNANAADNATTGLNFYGETNMTYKWTEDDGFTAYDSETQETTKLKGILILGQLKVNSELTATDGHKKLATRSAERDDDGYIIKVDSSGNVINPTLKDANGNTYFNPDYLDSTKATVKGINGTGDGSNAVWMAALLNCEKNSTSPEVSITTDATTDTTARVIGNSSLFSYYNTNMTTMGSATSNMNNRVEFQANVMDQIEDLRDSTSGVNWDEELSNMIMFQQGYSACSRCLTTMDECLDKLVNSTGTVGR